MADLKRIEADRALLRRALRCDPDEYLRGHLRDGSDPDVIREDIHERTGGRLDASCDRIINIVADLVRRTPARDDAPFRSDRTPGTDPGAQMPSRMRKASGLEAHLDSVLGEPSRGYVIKHLKIRTSKGTPERQLFESITESLVRRGAHPALTSGQVKTLAISAGWRTERAKRKEAQRRRAQASKPSGSDARGFWAGIRTQRSLRQVSGGLPSLGKRR